MCLDIMHADAVDWFSLLPHDGLLKAPATAFCLIGDESDTARRFIYNEDPVAKSLWNMQRTLFSEDGLKMIYVGIDAAKDKHDCCILGSNGQVIREAFTFSNSQIGFGQLHAAIQDALARAGTDQIKAGLESTGHYSGNLVAFLRSSGVEPVVFNPLQVNLFRKSQSLRKTKTDKVDAKCISQLLMSAESNPVPVSYQIQELKTLTWHRFRLIAQ